MFHDLSDRIRRGETLIGTWLVLNNVGVAEIVARAGFDFVIIDMEHGATGFDNLRNLILALEHHTAPVVRAKGNQPEFITGPLDLGAAAVIIPRVNSAKAAEQAVEATKYHPIGERGVGPYRLSGYGDAMQEVFEKANEKQMLWVQLEHADAMEKAVEIISVPGIDLFFIGRGDLAASMGHIGDDLCTEVVESSMNALRLIRNADLPVASAFGLNPNLKPWYDAGMRVFTVASDFRFVKEGAAQSLAAVRRSLE